MSLNVIIPMAGLGSRFTSYGFKTNKYLLPIDLNLTKMIEKAILTLNINIPAKFIFILREENGTDIDLREFLKSLCDTHGYTCEILSTNVLTDGPARTAYLAKDLVNNDTPLIISNSDQILEWNFNSFMKKANNYDGCVLTYTPSYDVVIGGYDKNSFVRCDEYGKCVEFTEKKVISKEALVGLHYYRKGSYFVNAAEYIFQNNIRAHNNEFYISHTYQAMINMNQSVGSYMMSSAKNEYYYSVGNPDDYFKYYHSQHPLPNYLLSDFEIFNKVIGFSVLYHACANTSLTFKNSLVIVIKGKIKNHSNIFISGDSQTITFEEDTYYFMIDDVCGEFLNVDLSNYVRGWLVGNFIPSVKRTSKFEVGVITHKKDEKWGFHYHNKLTELNILLQGRMTINGIPLKEKDMFIFPKNMIACPHFLEDCTILCIKIPSVPTDKITI